MNTIREGDHVDLLGCEVTRVETINGVQRLTLELPPGREGFRATAWVAADTVVRSRGLPPGVGAAVEAPPAAPVPPPPPTRRAAGAPVPAVLHEPCGATVRDVENDQ